MSSQQTLKGVGIGAGYFSHYQYSSWERIPQVNISGIYNRTVSKAEAMAEQYNIPNVYADYKEMLDQEKPDFVDIITPPETHLEMCQYAAERGIHIICQKPLAPTYEECIQIVESVKEAGVRFMVHENFRWQPWYREIKRLIENDVLGEVFTAYFRMRTGDGWGENAYIPRQPFFRNYPRLLVYETGVHFLDTFRYLFGEVDTIYARLRQLNPIIKGEDCGHLIVGMQNGITAVWDSNRYNENDAENPRYTFGEMRIDGRKGHLELGFDGNITIKPLGEDAYQHQYAHQDVGFAGGCVHAIQEHFVEQFCNDGPFENTGEDYLKTIQLVEACYLSAKTGQVVKI